jgi:hypothetical protein
MDYLNIEKEKKKKRKWELNINKIDNRMKYMKKVYIWSILSKKRKKGD